MATRLQRVLSRQVDAAGLAAFRIGFGLLLALSAVRFVACGWVEELLTGPSYHFTYAGFDWITPLGTPAMYGVFGIMALSALSIALGLRTRSAAAVFFLTFTYVELIDKTTYLNHYYLVSLLAFLLVIFPCDQAFALSRKGPEEQLPLLHYFLFRFQIGLVYFFAGLAKLNADWLFRAEPLAIWLPPRADVFPLLGEPWVPFVMSWCGALFDLSVPFLLAWKATRPFAYAAVVVFHVLTWLLFPIGVFPWVMIVSATVFFAPDWPRRLLQKWRWRRVAPSASPSLAAPARIGFGIWAFALAFCLVQLALPLRYLAHPGWVNWHEQGFRFAWRVMLIEKAGLVEYDVVTRDGRHFREFPRKSLTHLQYRMLTTQPDMIAQYARHLAQVYALRGEPDVQVYARSRATLNRRTSQVLVRPDVDLARPQGGVAFVEPLQNERP